jgi:hypothetical protein
MGYQQDCLYLNPFLNVYKRIVRGLNRNFAVWGGGVAAPSEIDDSKSKTGCIVYVIEIRRYHELNFITFYIKFLIIPRPPDPFESNLARSIFSLNAKLPLAMNLILKQYR